MERAIIHTTVIPRAPGRTFSRHDGKRVTATRDSLSRHIVPTSGPPARLGKSRMGPTRFCGER